MSSSLIDAAWEEHLLQLLHRVQPSSAVSVERQLPVDAVDGAVTFDVGGRPHRLLIQAKALGQPRYASQAADQLPSQLKRMVDYDQIPSRGMLVAPFISRETRELLRRRDIDWLDLAGNAGIHFSDFIVLIEKADRDPAATKREHRSLFAPKSARILKQLLLRPSETWLVKELAAAADASVGLVSRLRQALEDREWIVTESAGGMRLTRPDALLDHWRDAAEAPLVAIRGYTTLFGQALEKTIEEAFPHDEQRARRVRLASFSAARRIAPFARVGGEYLYADEVGQSHLKDALALQPAGSGANVTIYRALDEGVWQHPMKVGQAGMRATDPIQTYLDLHTQGELGRQAAEYWRNEVIRPMWKGDAT